MSATAAGGKAFISVGTTLRQGSEFSGKAGHVRHSSALFWVLAASTEHTHGLAPCDTGWDTASAVTGVSTWQGGVSHCPHTQKCSAIKAGISVGQGG